MHHSMLMAEFRFRPLGAFYTGNDIISRKSNHGFLFVVSSTFGVYLQPLRSYKHFSNGRK